MVDFDAMLAETKRLQKIEELARADLPETDLDTFSVIGGDYTCEVCKHKITSIDSLCEARDCRRFQLRELLKAGK